MNIKQLISSIKGMTPTATDDVAARSVDLYPDWAAGLQVKAGDRYQCDGLLHKALQDHVTQDNWRPGQATASIWQVIDVTHAGTLDDPIPFALNMVVYKDKYYTWEGRTYLCTRDSGDALQDPPDQLIGHYFKEA